MYTCNYMYICHDIHILKTADWIFSCLSWNTTVPVKYKLTVMRNSNDTTWSSTLETRTFRGLRLELSFKTFEAIWEFIESSFQTFESSFQTFKWKKQRTFCAINFWHIWIWIAYFSFPYHQCGSGSISVWCHVWVKFAISRFLVFALLQKVFCFSSLRKNQHLQISIQPG